MLRNAWTDGKYRRIFLVQKTWDSSIAASWESSDLLTAFGQDFSMDHKDIDLLRLRSFTLGSKLSDGEVVGPGGIDRIAELIACIEPFVSLPRFQWFDDEFLAIH